MPENLRSLWQRAVADSRREIERLRDKRPDLRLDRDLDDLLTERWPQARQAAIESLAREEAGGSEARYRSALRRLDRTLPKDYPFLRCDADANS
ncbi:MAG: hypothetical protein F4Y47_02790 [Acidobacteriia bacterium]|nr:hypothetical protein [Terriglobia bacterium]MYG03215.1 hypothetical protein [Terriglobia bacterium]MYK09471.1 hypothetical protein [Terriglobia bacterium]